MFLGEINNLDKAVKVIQEADADIPAKLAENPECNIVVCYRRQNISRVEGDKIFEGVDGFVETVI